MPKPFHVVITDFITDALEPEHKILGEIANIEAVAAASELALAGKVEQADALMMYHCLAITGSTIERLQKCKIIVRCGVGYDNVDYRLARCRGESPP